MDEITKIFSHNDYLSTDTDEPREGIEIANSKIEKYVPPRRKKKMKKLALIISCVVSVIVMVIFSSVYLFADDGGLVLPSKSGLIITGGNRIWFFNLETNNFTQLIQSKNDIQAFDVYQNEAILWSEENIPMIKSSSENFNNITYSKILKPQAIAVDYVTGNVYMIHKSIGTLNVIDKKGEKYDVVLSDLKKPNDLALDVGVGLIFIGQQLGSIVRAAMDGTNITTIDSGRGASLITIDPDKKRIYWVNDDHGIMSANYEGMEVKIMTECQKLVKGLAFNNGKLFWLIPEVLFASDNGTLVSCHIGNNGCEQLIKYQIPFENPKSLKAVYYRRYTKRKIENPCRKKNCSGLCILTKDGLPKCT